MENSLYKLIDKSKQFEPGQRDAEPKVDHSDTATIGLNITRDNKYAPQEEVAHKPAMPLPN